jgi:hypothetical protein
MAAMQRQRPVTALLSAAEDVVEAGQQAMLDRFELMRTEAMDEAREFVVDSAMIVVSAALAAFGWVLLSIALVLLLAYVVAPWLATALVAVPHLLIGIGLAWYAARRFRTQTRAVSATLSDTVFQSPLHE